MPTRTWEDFEALLKQLQKSTLAMMITQLMKDAGYDPTKAYEVLNTFLGKR